ncbi:winged helix-turn-helix transcriptional regulator [Virgibacillus sp. NKC19-3]|uniref:ArsR/SmtB family transcription factor n=1 Tax=Virgibacillus saliphilus TaxID=2831674 RepID=UPI001C9B5194|nr:metalloregulator ArsR/SmtB family transcription factor [Virgibacillus sp. NKC19-3]MBY7141784.1 winged helix-turn-helix transcriptional regulator [Virgibacillus sp. NKC19-3]
MLKTTVEIEKAASILKLLGDKTRLTTIKILDKHDCCVCELVEIFNASQPAISQHLRKLRDIGLIREERKGQWIFYSVNKTNEFYPFVQQIIEQLPSQDHKLKELEEKGTRIICC